MAQPTGYRDKNSTADRALAILELYTDARPTLSATELAAELGVARSTAYRYLETLVHSQFLAEDGRGGFHLGPKVIQLARLARRAYNFSGIAVTAMKELAEQVRHTVLLTALSGASVICVEREESDAQYLRLSYERGTILPLNAGASALALLAWLPPDELDRLLDSTPLAKLTPATIDDPEALRARLAEVRSAGYCVTRGEVDQNAIGIAAPILRPGGAPATALSVVMIAPAADEAEIEAITAAVMATAQRLTETARSMSEN